MSFTVTRGRREIGIRAALGAQPRRVLRAVFARAAGQVGLGSSSDSWPLSCSSSVRAEG